MTSRRIATFMGCAVVAAGALALASGAARAQAPDSTITGEEIIVEAPFARREDTGREPGSLLRRERVSYSIPVSVADPDPDNPSDQARAEDRIRGAAREACRQLDRRYPPNLYIPVRSESRRDCAEHAADDGMAQIQTIADARTGR